MGETASSHNVHPSTTDFMKLLNKNGLLSCPVAPNNVHAADHIFYLDVGALKGKTAHHCPPS